jgi:hypothetical protein
MPLHPVLRGTPIAPDSSSDRPHLPTRDETVLAANSPAAVVSSGIDGKPPGPFQGCIPSRECGAVPLASLPLLRVPTLFYPFLMVPQTAMRSDRDCLLTCWQFAWVSPVQQTQQSTWEVLLRQRLRESHLHLLNLGPGCCQLQGFSQF